MSNSNSSRKISTRSLSLFEKSITRNFKFKTSGELILWASNFKLGGLQKVKNVRLRKAPNWLKLDPMKRSFSS